VDQVTEDAVAAAGGDRVALARMVRATQADVWRFCAHLAEPTSADDLTQEVYVRAMRALPGFRADASARTWLLAIARRTVADHIRARTRRRDVAATGPSFPQAVVTAADEHVVLRAMVAALAPERRLAFELTQVLGLSYAEAAQVCRCPVGTIRSRVARARGDLIVGLGSGAAAAQ
jgi:RNA polymerase sigma-70 factor (ECF subfamily)